MQKLSILMLALAATGLVALGTGIGYWLRPTPAQQLQTVSTAASSGKGRILYYKNPMGLPDTSPVPKKDSMGMDYIPVYASEAASTAATGKGRILYYKNPMGLPDTSPVPKKDSMGMDYIPVYGSEAENEPGVVSVSPARVQMLGVRTAPVETRSSLTRAVKATGTIQPDESRLTSVTTKFDGVVDKLFVSTTGTYVHAGDPLARVWIQTPDTMMQTGPDVITREIDLVIALQDKNPVEIAQADAVLRQYGIPDSTIAEIHRTDQATRFVTITAPRSGVVLEKPAIEGMHFNTGDPLYKIADLSTVWLMADVEEQDFGAVKLGDTATASLVAYPGRTFTGKVDFIYPSLLANTRAGQVRIVLPNQDGLLRESMYANVTIDTPASSGAPMIVVPDSAIINSGTKQVALIALGEGRYQPRAVEVGASGDGYSQILSGLKPGEQVVVGANFLIDAESNLQAALQAFSSTSGAQVPGGTP